jgi:hypothetical protein
MRHQSKTRTQYPRRFRRARGDATLAALVRTIVQVLDVPEKAVRLIRPDGRKMRSDATVERLRETWGY